jgi:BESS motif
VEFKRIPRDEQTGELLISPEDYDSKWANYKPLLFLAEHLRSRTGNRDSEGVSVKRDSFDYDDVSTDDHKELLAFCEEKAQQIVKPQITIRPIENLSSSAIPPRIKPVTGDVQPPAKRCKLDDEYTAPESSSASGNIDDDYHFLMSLHPYMIDLNASQKLRVRMKIQKVIFKELFKDEDDLDDMVAK